PGGHEPSVRLGAPRAVWIGADQVGVADRGDLDIRPRAFRLAVPARVVLEGLEHQLDQGGHVGLGQWADHRYAPLGRWGWNGPTSPPMNSAPLLVLRCRRASRHV